MVGKTWSDWYAERAKFYSICKTFNIPPHPLFPNTPPMHPRLKTQLWKTQPSAIQPPPSLMEATELDLFPSSVRLSGKTGPNAELKAVLSHWWGRGSRNHLTWLEATAPPSAQNSVSAARQFRPLTAQSKLPSAAECSFSSSSHPSLPSLLAAVGLQQRMGALALSWPRITI